jgi:hypothetical protein
MDRFVYGPFTEPANYLPHLLRDENVLKVLSQAEKIEINLADAISKGIDRSDISNIAANAATCYAYAFNEMLRIQSHKDAITFYETGLLLYKIAENRNPHNPALKKIREFYLSRKDNPYPLLRNGSGIINDAEQNALERAKRIGYM